MIHTVSPAEKLTGTLTPPPDKSISHRSAMFAALADGRSVIENYSPAADPASTLSCLAALGVVLQRDGDRVTVNGKGRKKLIKPAVKLDCGNSGTTMRLLSGILAGAGVDAVLTGDDSLSARTMKRVVEPLSQMGGSISAKSGEFAPLEISGHHGIRGMRYPLPIASAQLKSAVLLAGLYGEKPTEVVESVPSRDHTERLLGLQSEAFGTGKVIRSSLSDEIPLQNYRVPGDFSAAAFWLVAGSVRPGSEITLKKCGMNPTRTGAYQILKLMGADIEVLNPGMAGNEPVADLVVRSTELKPVSPDPLLVPNSIDELPVLMVAMCFADGTSVITGAEELRHKETDRLEAMGKILEAAGANFELSEDGITIEGSPSFKPKPAQYPSFHDHRMAMAAAVMATAAGRESSVLDAECTAISYPDFWTHLSELSA